MGLDLEDAKLREDLLRTSADLAALLNGLVPTTKALAKAPHSTPANVCPTPFPSSHHVGSSGRSPSWWTRVLSFYRAEPPPAFTWLLGTKTVWL